jgi:geranylgeranyl pyrophosphate synthase
MATPRQGSFPLGNDAARAVLDEVRAAVDAELESCALEMEGDHSPPIGPALAYALRSPGKRVRPALLMAAYRAAGGTSQAIAGIAAAVEVVHTYSLIHDDLPCMDDDPLRRGRPTTHVVFGVPVATRVGWLLVPVAAELLARRATAMGLDTAVLADLAATLFEAGGIRGMVGGQWLDLVAEGRSLALPDLVAVHRAKTGALIAAAVEMGAIAAGASGQVRHALGRYGAEVGVAFQIADDVLDATSTSDQLGKTAGKDAEVAKSTYVGVLGVPGARAEALAHARRAMAALEGAGVSTETLGPLARYIVSRTS